MAALDHPDNRALPESGSGLSRGPPHLNCQICGRRSGAGCACYTGKKEDTDGDAGLQHDVGWEVVERPGTPYSQWGFRSQQGAAAFRSVLFVRRASAPSSFFGETVRPHNAFVADFDGFTINNSLADVDPFAEYCLVYNRAGTPESMQMHVSSSNEHSVTGSFVLSIRSESSVSMKSLSSDYLRRGIGCTWEDDFTTPARLLEQR